MKRQINLHIEQLIKNIDKGVINIPNGLCDEEFTSILLDFNVRIVNYIGGEVYNNWALKILYLGKEYRVFYYYTKGDKTYRKTRKNFLDEVRKLIRKIKPKFRKKFCDESISWRLSMKPVNYNDLRFFRGHSEVCSTFDEVKKFAENCEPNDIFGYIWNKDKVEVLINSCVSFT